MTQGGMHPDAALLLAIAQEYDAMVVDGKTDTAGILVKVADVFATGEFAKQRASQIIEACFTAYPHGVPAIMLGSTTWLDGFIVGQRFGALRERENPDCHNS